MAWVNVAVTVGGAIAGSMASDSGGSQTNGGAGTTTGTKEPWLQAQPWIKNNLASGQALQNQYTQNPFNAQQLNAHQNLSNQTGYMNNLVPSLLGQIDSQPMGFNRANPNARPNAYSFDGMGGGTGGAGAGGSGGLLGMLSNPATGSTSAVNPPPPPPPPAEPAGTFTQQSLGNTGMVLPQFANEDPATRVNPITDMFGVPMDGGYGTFKYGAAMPTAGTQQYRDMSAYFANGGYDPSNLYGRSTYKGGYGTVQQGGGGGPGAGGIGAAGGVGAGSSAGGVGW